MKEVKILGAGISGLTAAINLAKSGLQVTVYEKNQDVGMRFHGDVQGLENWSEKRDVVEQLKDMNIKISFDCDPFNEITLTDCKHEKTIKTKRPLYYLVKRGNFPGSLDFELKRQAQESGVKILFGKTIDPEDADIVATGPLFKEIPGIDTGIIFNTDFEDKAVLVFNDELAFKGYSYLLISKGYGCMCSVVMDELDRINASFENTKNFFDKKYSLNSKSVKKVGGVGSFALRHILEVKHKKNETFYVGEAAGLQDFLWGFGMRYAFESGYLAADCIIKEEDYEVLARKKFERKLKAGMVNRYLWETLGDKAYSFIVKHPLIAKRSLRSMHNFNPIQRFLFQSSLRYLKRKYPLLEV